MDNLFDVSDSRRINKNILFPNANIAKGTKISNISVYSICLPKEADLISKILKNFFTKKDIVITDGTACVGGNTISFAKNFKSINAIELEKFHYDMLLYNIDLYGFSHKVNIYCDNFINIFHTLQQDIIYLDPPWGGPTYKKEYKLELYIDNYSMEDIYDKIKQLHNETKIFCFRAPLNYDYLSFLKNIKCNYIYFYKFKKYILVICLTDFIENKEFKKIKKIAIKENNIRYFTTWYYKNNDNNDNESNDILKKYEYKIYFVKKNDEYDENIKYYWECFS